MANTEVGSAYVTIYPQTDGNFSKQVGKQMGDGVSAGLSSKAVAIGNIISDVAMRAASAVGDVFADAFGSYADYEQLVGGVDTLFKESSATVQQYAQDAYKTAGMSANQYMEQVTSFSASLLQSLGGDTGKAADYADMAMRDMSDNANKMGSSMQSITDAYQGFAKQNYTMLDNLKLGYGGTKGEMERLLADASKIAGVEFNIDSYSDVIEAIHVMQESMGIAGATADEAEGTISGSINMMKASWQNFMTELGKSDADVGARAQELVDSIVAVVKNIAPRLLVFAQNLFAAIPSLIEELQPYIDQFMALVGQFIEEHRPQIEAAANVMFDGMVDGLTTIIAKLIEHLPDIIAKLGEKVPDIRGRIQAAAFEMFGGLLSGLGQNVAPLLADVGNVMQQAIGKVTGFFDNFRQAGAGIVGRITGGISGAVGRVQDAIGRVTYAITHPVETAKDTIKRIADTISGIFSGLRIELPHIAMPHFQVDGGQFPWGVGGQGYAPTFDVRWYARGGIVEGASLIGAGERGAELIWPSYEPYISKYASAIAEHMPNGAGVDIHDCTFNVRQESDIRRVAQELDVLVRRQMGGALA